MGPMDDEEMSNYSGKRRSNRSWPPDCRAAGSSSGGLASAAVASMGGVGAPEGRADLRARTGCAAPAGLPGIPVSSDDTVVVPPGYTAKVLIAWGDPVSRGPLQARRQQQRRRSGTAMGHAQRRHRLLHDRWLVARAARPEQRIHR